MITQADAVAMMELEEFSTLLHAVSFDPESCVKLSIDGTTVTSSLLPTPSQATTIYWLEQST
jgi:hypothetical protein